MTSVDESIVTTATWRKSNAESGRYPMSWYGNAIELSTLVGRWPVFMY